MADYIDRDVAIQKMTDLFAEFPDEIGHYLQGRCIGVLLFLPAEDVVKVKHAHYEVVPNQTKKQIVPDVRCSNCQRVLKHKKENYCPHCGAKMTGEDK